MILWVIILFTLFIIYVFWLKVVFNSLLNVFESVLTDSFLINKSVRSLLDDLLSLTTKLLLISFIDIGIWNIIFSSSVLII